jgi:sulfite reductase alpha subunit-like flavoprotein
MVETLSEEQMQNFYSQDELREQIKALKRMLSQGRNRMGEND